MITIYSSQHKVGTSATITLYDSANPTDAPTLEVAVFATTEQFAQDTPLVITPPAGRDWTSGTAALRFASTTQDVEPIPLTAYTTAQWFWRMIPAGAATVRDQVWTVDNGYDYVAHVVALSGVTATPLGTVTLYQSTELTLAMPGGATRGADDTTLILTAARPRGRAILVRHVTGTADPDHLSLSYANPAGLQATAGVNVDGTDPSPTVDRQIDIYVPGGMDAEGRDIYGQPIMQGIVAWEIELLGLAAAPPPESDGTGNSTLLGTDLFDRVVTGGFGEGPLGSYHLLYDAYVVGDPNTLLAVTGGQGRVTLPDGDANADLGQQYRRALALESIQTNSEQQVDIVFSGAATINAVNIGLLLRFWSLNAYLLIYGTEGSDGNWRLNFTDASTSFGSVSTTIPYGYGTYRLRVRACADPDFPDYTAIMAKFWRPGIDLEPAWSASKYPPFTPPNGHCGLFVGGGVSGGSAEVAFDNYSLWNNPCAPPLPEPPGGSTRQRLYWIS